MYKYNIKYFKYKKVKALKSLKSSLRFYTLTKTLPILLFKYKDLKTK